MTTGRSKYAFTKEELKTLRELYYSDGVHFKEVWLLTYKCNCCGHVWKVTSEFVLEYADCVMGCSRQPTLLEMIFRTRRGMGHGELIKKELLDSSVVSLRKGE